MIKIVYVYIYIYNDIYIYIYTCIYITRYNIIPHIFTDRFNFESMITEAAGYELIHWIRGACTIAPAHA